MTSQELSWMTSSWAASFWPAPYPMTLSLGKRPQTWWWGLTGPTTSTITPTSQKLGSASQCFRASRRLFTGCCRIGRSTRHLSRWGGGGEAASHCPRCIDLHTGDTGVSQNQIRGALLPVGWMCTFVMLLVNGVCDSTYYVCCSGFAIHIWNAAALLLIQTHPYVNKGLALSSLVVLTQTLALWSSANSIVTYNRVIRAVTLSNSASLPE